MLTLACEIFPKMSSDLLDTACEIGETVWKEGLSLKGNKLLDGIPGNSYLLHNLFRTFNKLSKTQNIDKDLKRQFARNALKWRSRAFIFALSLCDERINNLIKNYNISRKYLELNLHPYSLMEGHSGEVYLISDLLLDESQVAFPGFEI